MKGFFFFILISLVPFELCGASGKLSFKLTYYKNLLAREADGKCCDWGERSLMGFSYCRYSCDHYFIVCLDTPTDFGRCRIGEYKTEVTADKNIIIFGSSIGNTPNPKVIKFTNLPVGGLVRVKVKVMDSDLAERYGRSKTPAFVDSFHTDVKLEVGKTGQFRAKNRTELKFTTTIECDEHSYGSTCGDYCKPSEDFNCGPDGNKLPIKLPQPSGGGSGNNISNSGQQKPPQQTGYNNSHSGQQYNNSHSVQRKPPQQTGYNNSHSGQQYNNSQNGQRKPPQQTGYNNSNSGQQYNNSQNGQRKPPQQTGYNNSNSGQQYNNTHSGQRKPPQQTGYNNSNSGQQYNNSHSGQRKPPQQTGYNNSHSGQQYNNSQNGQRKPPQQTGYNNSISGQQYNNSQNGQRKPPQQTGYNNSNSGQQYNNTHSGQRKPPQQTGYNNSNSGQQYNNSHSGQRKPPQQTGYNNSNSGQQYNNSHSGQRKPPQQTGYNNSNSGQQYNNSHSGQRKPPQQTGYNNSHNGQQYNNSNSGQRKPPQQTGYNNSNSGQQYNNSHSVQRKPPQQTGYNNSHSGQQYNNSHSGQRKPPQQTGYNNSHSRQQYNNSHSGQRKPPQQTGYNNSHSGQQYNNSSSGQRKPPQQTGYNNSHSGQQYNNSHSGQRKPQQKTGYNNSHSGQQYNNSQNGQRKPPQQTGYNNSLSGLQYNNSHNGQQYNNSHSGAQKPPRQSSCGVKPHFNQSIAAKTVVPAKPEVDIVLTAIPQKDIPVITVKCNDSGHYKPEASLKNFFKSIQINVNTSVSRKVAAALDSTCLPHVVAVYARPRSNKQEMNMNTRTRSAFCGPDKQAKGSFGPDDQLLAVESFEVRSWLSFLFQVTGWKHKISLDTKLEFGKYSCQLCGNLTLILHVDPLGVLNDTNPCNNFITLDVTFDCEKCPKPNNKALKELPLLHPYQPPLLKYCGAGKNGTNIIVQAKRRKGSFQWTTLKNQQPILGDMMKFPLAYQIMEMLKKTDGKCPKCKISASDICTTARRVNAPSNVDIGDWKNFVTKMQGHVAKLLSKKYNASSKLTQTQRVEKLKRLSTNINSSVECIFKKLKQAGPTTCPFRRDMLPKLYQFQHDACRNSEDKMLGQVGQLFDDENSEDMADGKYLGAFADSLCPENRPDRQEERRDFCTKGTKKPEMSEESSCNFVNLLRNILRESKSARQLLFPKLNKDALARMGPNLLSQRLTNTLIASGISRSDLEKSSLWNVIKGVDKKCQPDPSYPGCPEPTRQIFFKEDEKKTLCMVKNPDESGEMCAVECARSQCGCNSTAGAGDGSARKTNPNPIGPARNMTSSQIVRRKRNVEDNEEMTDFDEMSETVA